MSMFDADWHLAWWMGGFDSIMDARSLLSFVLLNLQRLIDCTRGQGKCLSALELGALLHLMTI